MDTWKPDFTKDNPWIGMPADYAGIATFIPTESVPLPPWEGKVGAGAIPAYGTPIYAQVALEIAQEAYTEVTAPESSRTEKEQATFILESAMRAAEQGAGVASAYTMTSAAIPTVTKEEAKLDVAKLDVASWLPWLLIGGVALVALRRR